MSKLLIYKDSSAVLIAVDDDGSIRDSSKPNKMNVWERDTTGHNPNKDWRLRVAGASKDEFESIEGASAAPDEYADYKYDKLTDTYTKLSAQELSAIGR